MAATEPLPFEPAGMPALRGESIGEGPPIVLLHGITATRRYVVHGSKLLPRRGYEVITYDARGHGESGAAPDNEGYGYPWLVADLERVIEERVGEGRFLLGGHSMGAHTAVAYALEHPERLAGLVVIGPVYAGVVTDEALAYWDGLADALERDGVEGFVAFIDAQGPDPQWRETILRITRERIARHRNPRALATALREVPRSRPFDSLAELEFLDVPTLVVASHDVADPGHPYSVAEAYAERIPGARLVSEAEGDSPLAWQGGKLSREIADFASLISFP
jgi:pimeloyl-ACP methyl ester carboxylesterase